ncbi:hypothetical protein [Desulfitobacterium dehalogenans]|nr:hypothetical protein [Desulfitobacterium dehalogenans]
MREVRSLLYLHGLAVEPDIFFQKHLDKTYRIYLGQIKTVI